MSELARDFVFAEKELSGDLQWYEGDKNSLSLVASIDIAGVTVEGLKLRITAIKSFPNEDVVIQFEHLRDRRKYVPVWRMEWKPLREHNNKGLGPEKWRFRKVRQTHIHPFEENLAEQLRNPRNDKLPIAYYLSTDLETFEQALEMAGKDLNINNMYLIPRPPWQERLL